MRITLRQQGFSLPEVLLAMALLVMIVTALGGFHRALVTDLATWSQYRTLWRHTWLQTQQNAPVPPSGWRVQRVQTSEAGCVSINAILHSPSGRTGQMTRLHCPKDR